MPVKVSVKNGKISNQMTMEKRLDGLGEVRIVDETNGFGLNFVKKKELNLKHHPRRGSSALKKDRFGTCI